MITAFILGLVLLAVYATSTEAEDEHLYCKEFWNGD